MSRAYRIRIKESLARDIRAEDEICSQIEILEVLPPEQMGELLAQELEKRGFEREEDGTLTREGDGVTVTVDPCECKVTIRASTEEHVELEANKEGYAYDDVGPGSKSVRQNLEKEAKADLERRATQKESELQTKATEKLEKELERLQPEINEVVNRVTSEALKQKAAQMGTIKEISEDAESGSLTITVEV